MLEKNVWQRMLIIAGVLVVAGLIYWSNGLRYGNDIAGGVSMIFELKEESGQQTRGNVAERVKEQLQKRVDPHGVYDLTWRVHGTNRIEVQMPLPPVEASARREAYAKAQDAITETNITRGEALAAFNVSDPAAREAKLAELAAGVAGRAKALTDAAKAFEAKRAAEAAYDEALAAGDVEPKPDMNALKRQRLQATEEFADALADVMDTNIPQQRLLDVLEMKAGSDRRKAALAAWIGVEGAPGPYWALRDSINDLVAKYDDWKSNKKGLDSPADLKRLVRGAGVLSFHIMVENDPNNRTRYDGDRKTLEELGPRSLTRSGMKWFKVDNPVGFFDVLTAEDLEKLELDKQPYVVGRHGGDWYVLAHTDSGSSMEGGPQAAWKLSDVGPSYDQSGRPCIRFAFDAVGADIFGKLTEQNVGRQLGIFLDDNCYSAPNIREKIRGNGEITGDYTISKVQQLVQTMEAGALPARLKDTPISERSLGSALGEKNREMALSAGVWGVALVVVIMAVYYLRCGLIANVALLMNVALVLAAMSMLQARLTLPGIAGIILSMGMAVDANVLIFERMREEKDRGSSLRMIVKNGYDKAFSTIIDANITTLLTCIILYYVGSEEVKGFGLTLGWGIVISLFTALYVTRAFFGLLLKYHRIKDIKMLRLIGVPKIDWYAKRKFFIPMSLLIIIVGCGFLYTRGADALDVEFRGGVSADIELKQPVQDERQLADSIEKAAAHAREACERLGEATVTPVAGDPTLFNVTLPGVDASLLAALIAEPLEDAGLLSRAGVEMSAGADSVSVRLDGGNTQTNLQQALTNIAGTARDIESRLAKATISAVLDGVDADSKESEKDRVWSITSTETNKRLVQHVLEEAMGDNLVTQPAVAFTESDPRPVVFGETLADLTGVRNAMTEQTDVSEFADGAALLFSELSPALTTKQMETRLKSMRLQPDYADLPWREFKVVGVQPAGEVEGEPTYNELAVLVTDPELAYSTKPDEWRTIFADREQDLVEAALANEQTLRKVSQFKPAIAAQSQTKAVMALILSAIMIIGYLWFRFGRVTYGVAGVIALVHDVLIALAAVGISHWIGGKGGILMIEDFYINMTIVAAFLTIIGYSINDTIVVFDRIREMRGRQEVTPKIINDAINQCLSRTIMTSFTTLAVLLTMYIFGGSSIRGFNYCMIVGILTGTYSSIAVAAPLLMIGLKYVKEPAPAETETAAV